MDIVFDICFSFRLEEFFYS